MIDLALYAASALLLLYALRVLTQKKDPDRPGASAQLGCGYFFLACLLGGLASRDLVGGWFNAARVAAGIFLIAPAVGALTRPHVSRLLLGVIGIVLAILIAGPVLQSTWSDIEEGRETGPRIELEEALGQLEETRAETSTEVEKSSSRALELKALIENTGHASFQELSADPEAMAWLEELELMQARIQLGEGQLAELEAKIEEARVLLAQLDSEQTDTSDAGSTIEIPQVTPMTPVEEYARQKELEVLYEEQFGDV